MGDLAGNAGQSANLLLRYVQHWMGLRIELGIEEFSQAARHTRIDVVHPIALSKRNELAEPCVELVDHEMAEAQAVGDQIVKGRARHKCNAAVAQRDNPVGTQLPLKNCALAEPTAIGYPR